ncbi:MAG: sensor histidine kinase [Acidimicrobiia bacterium]
MKALFRPLVQGSTYARALYLLLGLPLGIFYFVFLVVSLSLGVGLTIIWVGIFILFGAVLVWRGLGIIERALVEALLGERIDPPTSPQVAGTSYAKKAKAIISDSYTWRSFAWLLLRFPLGIFGFVVTVVLVSTTFSLIAAPGSLFIGDLSDQFSRTDVDFQPVEFWLEDFPEWTVWLLPVAGVFMAAVSAHVISGFGRLHGLMARPLLGPSEREQRAVLKQRTDVLEERTMLAHELHDSLGHTLTMMVVQAGAAGHVFDNDPEFARDALGNIETSGRQALGELDRILGLLREDQGAETAPQPDLTSLPGLVEQMSAAGMEIRLTTEGGIEHVPRDVSRFAYRIVQEALTNVLKHAGVAATDVRLHRTAGALEIEVSDDGPGRVANGDLDSLGTGGRGLVGLRERVALLGGSVEAGPRPEGGFRVWARLPID